jgi:hypothetical protein
VIIPYAIISQEIPSSWPKVTPEGVGVGIGVFVVVTLIAFLITKSKWSWLPGIIFGVIAAIAVSPSTTSTTQLIAIVGMLCWADFLINHHSTEPVPKK